MRPLVDVQNVSVDYLGARKVTALKNVSFTLGQNEILGIIGESGSGKTTLAYSLLNLLPENASIQGKVFLEGENVLTLNERELDRMRGKRIAIIPQEPAASFNPVFSIGYQFDEFLRIKNICRNRDEREKLIVESLEKAQLKKPRRIIQSYPHQLSGGQLQRAMIAMMIAVRPTVLIADEPTSSLDVTVENQLIHMLLSLRDEFDFSIIFITHNLGLIRVVCDRVVVLREGEVREIGTKREVMDAPKDSYSKALIDAVKQIEA